MPKEIERVIRNINYLISILFFAEAVIKIIVKGFVLHKYAYLRDPFNILDFVIALSG